MTLEERDAYFGRIMTAAIDLREILQEDDRGIDEDSPYRFMATAPIYISWILDDLIHILMLAHIPMDERGPRLHIKATRMLLCILEESNLHGRKAADLLEVLMPRDEEGEEKGEEGGR